MYTALCYPQILLINSCGPKEKIIIMKYVTLLQQEPFDTRM